MMMMMMTTTMTVIIIILYNIFGLPKATASRTGYTDVDVDVE